MGSRIEGDRHYTGNVTFSGDVQLPDGVVDAADIAAAAGIEPTKITQQHQKSYHLETPATSKEVVHVVYGATGTLLAFAAGARTVAGSGSVTVDLLVNGSSVLTGTITLNTGQSAFQLVDGTISSAALVVDDVIEILFTNSASDAVGLFAHVVLNEDPQ